MSLVLLLMEGMRCVLVLIDGLFLWLNEVFVSLELLAPGGMPHRGRTSAEKIRGALVVVLL